MSRMLALACALAAFALRPVVLARPLSSRPRPSSLRRRRPTEPPITLDDAKRAMAAAELEAAKNSWQVAITILDSGGNLVMFHKIDNTQLASIGASEGKASTALTLQASEQGARRRHRRRRRRDCGSSPSRTSPRSRAVCRSLVDGKIIGAIGVSGALSSQDAQVAKAGADALAK